MSSKIASSVERDALRERERQARALRAGLGSGDSAGHPIFRAPVKVDPGQEDELSRRIKNTLGDFSQVQRLLTHDPNHLIGISRTNAAAAARVPPTPVNGSSTASTWNGNATDPGGTRGGGGGSSGSSAVKQQQQHHGSSNHPSGQSSSTQQGSSSSHHGGSSHRSHHGSSSSSSGHHSSHHHSSHHHHKKQPHQQPGPPLMNGQYKSSSSAASKTGGRHPSQLPQGSSGHHHHQPSSRSSSSHEQQGRPEDAVPSNPKAPPPSSSCPVPPSSQGPPNGLVVRPPAMRAPSKDVNNGTTPAPTTQQHQSSTSSSSSLTVRTESNGPATGNKPPSSSSSASRSSTTESKPKRPVPWLQIPAPPSSDSGTASAHPELESILKEMKKIPPVLTAIETPRKEDRRPSFPTSPAQDQVPNHLEESGDSKHLLDPRKVASPPGSSLQDDLEMSDSDDDQEAPFGKTSSSLGFSISKNTPPPNESVAQQPPLVEKMSSSESSSSDSDDSSSASGSGSDSESSDSEGSAPEAGRESWQLADFIDKRSSSAMGLGGLATMAGRQSRAEDSLVDEDSFTPILSQYPNNRDADVAHMLKSPSPQGLELMRSPARMPPMFSLSPVHSSSSRSPAHPASQARSAPRSPSPVERPPAIVPTGATAALSDDEGPCQMQNGRITMRLGKQQPPPPKSDPEPPIKPQPEPVKRSWPSKASKKETSPSLVPNSRNKPVPSLVPPVVKPEPVESSAAAARAPTPECVTPVINRAPSSKRSHSDRYNEKRSKIHKPRPVLSDSSSDDEAPPAPVPPPSAGGRLPLLEDSRVVDQRTIATPSVPARGRPPKASRSDSKVHKGREGLVVPKREAMPRTPPEPPSLLSPIGQRCGSEVRESAPTAAAAALAAASAAAAASSDSVVVCVALTRLLRLPGRLGKPQPSPSRSRERQADVEPPSLAPKPDVAKPSLASGAAPASLAKGKSSSKRKSGPSEDRSSSREQEKKRRVSTGSSGSLRVKREPSEAPRPEEESESRHAWPAAEPLRSCDSPSSLSSYSSQRSNSRQHRGRPSSSSGKNRSSDKGSSRRDATPSSDKSNRRHHHHHRDKKESGSRSCSRTATDDRHSDSAAMIGSTDAVSSSQVHSWEGLLSSSDQSEVHGHETPGSRMGPLAMGLAVPHGTMGGLLASARKEEPPDKLGTQRGNPSQLLSFNSHREWESKNGSSDYFLCEAKRLKHEADREVHRTSQAVKYLEAVLYFILTGNAMEHGRADLDNVYRMYKETLTLIKHISSKFQKLQNDAYGSIDNKLAVLSLRCQSLLYKKLYELHKNDVRENMRALSDFQKGSLGKLASPPLAPAGGGRLQQRSPCQPSPHSPTPSPAGSVGSQSSGYSSCELASNGHGGGSRQQSAAANVVPVLAGAASAVAAAAPPPGAVALPQSQYLMLQRQIANLTCLHRCHDMWEQADSLTSRSHSREFFQELDRDCGKLTLHSSCSELVKYVQEGVCRLRQRVATTNNPADSST